DACSRFVQRIGGDDDISELLRHNQEVLGDSGVAGVAGAGGVAFPPKILNMTVPQVGHLPLIALRPFFITSSTASTISFLALHLTQYPSAIIKSFCQAPYAPRRFMQIPYGCPIHSVNCEKGAENPQKTHLTGPPGS